ncbi:4-coumarate--CoA ligase-like 9 [Manihot esculenta]|uniref:4-coumarate--CoA ligase-like 9 n=1 Tax=Manihot esculenta TaxID=3983 RepID=UPI001CC654C1|nr:4-coumarate--CoA ligase-like 9 [Manihot esculenta]
MATEILTGKNRSFKARMSPGDSRRTAQSLSSMQLFCLALSPLRLGSRLLGSGLLARAEDKQNSLSLLSDVETILDKDNFTLEELLDEDEIIQECKALNGRLINWRKGLLIGPCDDSLSSRTTGRVNGVILTHRNFTYMVATSHAVYTTRMAAAISFFPLPHFHVYGLCYFVTALTIGAAVVSMVKFDMKAMLTVIEESKVTHVAQTAPAVVLMTKDPRLLDDYDLSSLDIVACRVASLRKSVLKLFRQ